MKDWLTVLVVVLMASFAIAVYPEESGEPANSSKPTPDQPTEESTEDSSGAESEDVQDETAQQEEETEETSATPPKEPWTRAPVSTKVPVNYDIDLPQDI